MSENPSQSEALRQMVSMLDRAVLGIAEETIRAYGFLTNGTALLVVIDPADDSRALLYRIPDGELAEHLIQSSQREGARLAAEAERSLLGQGEPPATLVESAEDLKAYTAMALREALSDYQLAPIAG